MPVLPNGGRSYFACPLAAFFFDPGIGDTVAFRLGRAGFLAAAHRLIWACRIRPRASVLSLRRFAFFAGADAAVFAARLAGLLAMAIVSVELKSSFTS